MNYKQRLDWIDIAKGIGIILVVFAHTIVPQIRNDYVSANFLWIFIYNFHMPLFFFLSGWLFEKGLAHYNDKGKFILRKLKFLMLPYITFSAFAYIFINFALKIDKLASILHGGGYTAVGIKDAVLQIITYNGHIDQHLWFVFSLFLVFLINILLPKLLKSKPMLVILLVLYVSKAVIQYFGILNYTASDLFFFTLARVMYSKEKQCVVDRSLWKFIVTASVFIASNCLYSYFYVTQMPYGFIKIVLYLTRIASSVTGIFTVCAIADFLSSKAVSKPIKAIGLYSYDIYLMHAPFLVSGSMGILLSYSHLPIPLCCIAVLAAGIALPYVISKFIIRKIPLLSVPMLGRNYKTHIRKNKSIVA